MSNETAQETSSATETVPYGILAEFDSPGALIDAARAVRDAGYTKWDSHSPFPVHGIDPAMGIKPTILPLLVFGGGATGLALAIAMQTWMNGWDYPWLVSGKPLFSLPMQIPIAFELTVLLAGVTCFLAVWGLNRLPQVWHPLFTSERFARVTSDGFFISIEASDPKFDLSGARALLESEGSVAIEEISYTTSAEARRLPRLLVAFILGSAVLALLPFALIAKARNSYSDKPHYYIIPDMDFQPKYKAQNHSDFFPDERADRLPVAGTVARDELKVDSHLYRGLVDGAWATTFPAELRIDADFMKRGQERFDIYCAPCHGLAGEGDGMVALRADAVGAASTGWIAPSNLTQEAFARQPHGQLFNTITHGIRSMPPYGPQIREADRWAIVLYVRALQRSAHSRVDDVPAGARPGIR